MKKLNKETIQSIKDDTELFAKVARLMDIKPLSLAKAIEKNGKMLNQFSVVECIADHLHREPKELVAEY